MNQTPRNRKPLSFPFTVRRDFPYEIGYVELARRVPEREYYENMRGMLEAAGKFCPSYEAICESYRSYTPGRYVGYAYTILPNYCEAFPIITDGSQSISVEHGPLWREMIRKGSVAMGREPDQWPVIRPFSIATPAAREVRSRFIVIHDLQTGVAGFYPDKERFHYLPPPA